MKALILAGGMGKRLRPLTNSIPKPMVKVGGKPIIFWQIRWLMANGIDRFVLLGGYRASKLVSYIKSMGMSGSFEFSIEDRQLGSAGAISNARKFVEHEKEFLIVNGDNITDLNIARLRLNGRELACLAVVPYRSSKSLVSIKNRRIIGFEDRPFIGGYWYNAGVLLMGSKALKSLPGSGRLEEDVFPKLASGGRLSCAKFTGSYFNSIDSIKDAEEVDKDIRSGKVRL